MMFNAVSWYAQSIKPSWAPPSWLFSPVWAVLYLIIGITFGYVFYRALRGSLSRKVVFPFVLNLISNLIYSPIQFGLQNNYLATADILLILGTLVWALLAIRHHALWVSLANIPYFLWVSFATVLQITITILNR